MRLFGVNNSPSLQGVLVQECRGCRWDFVELKDVENHSCLPALGYSVTGFFLKYINGDPYGNKKTNKVKRVRRNYNCALKLIPKSPHRANLWKVRR